MDSYQRKNFKKNPAMTPEKLSFHLINYIERRSSEKNYVFKLALVLMCLSWMFATPIVLLFFLKDQMPFAWEVVMQKSQNLTSNLEQLAPGLWLSKKVFRLTIPVLINLMYLNPTIVILFQIAAGYLTSVFSYKLSFRLLKDPVQATFLTAGLAFLYFGRAAYFEYDYCWFDAFSYIFILLAMQNTNAVLVFLFSFMASWNDERGFIALFVVLLFHQFENLNDSKIYIRDVFKINKRVAAVLGAAVLYVAIRLFLSMQFDMHTPLNGANFHVFNRTYYYFLIGNLTFFEGFWLLLMFALILLFYRKDYLRLILLTSSFLIIMVVSFCVSDITRSGAFAVPLVFIAVDYLKQSQSVLTMRKLLFLCLLVSFFIPPVFVCADWTAKQWVNTQTLVFLIKQIFDIL